MPNQLKTLDFKDTFLNFQHLRDSFPSYDVKVDVSEDQLVAPFKLTFKEATEEDPKRSIFVEPYKALNRGPYPQNEPKKNSVPFTPTQVEAIRSGITLFHTLIT